jgi:glycosyltransferase involved in cell wall biosynthesis
MAELARDPARRHEIGSAGRKRAQEAFSHPAVAQSTLELWQQLAVPV